MTWCLTLHYTSCNDTVVHVHMKGHIVQLQTTSLVQPTVNNQITEENQQIFAFKKLKAANVWDFYLTNESNNYLINNIFVHQLTDLSLQLYFSHLLSKEPSRNQRSKFLKCDFSWMFWDFGQNKQFEDFNIDSQKFCQMYLIIFILTTLTHCLLKALYFPPDCCFYIWAALKNVF